MLVFGGLINDKWLEFPWAGHNQGQAGTAGNTRIKSKDGQNQSSDIETDRYL